MTLVQFIEKNFRPATLATIERVNVIVDEYQVQGFRLTLRQLYYQMVARDMIPNSQRSYKNLGSVVVDGRLAGLIDWDSIEDRTRNMVANAHWRTPGSIIDSAAYSFRVDKWANQPNRVEIWVEKEALAGVISPICRRHDVGFFAARGYPSASEMYSAGKRFIRYLANQQDVHILHLGDHDPSGIDMTRDIMDRVQMFAEAMIGIDRLALNFDQINAFNPPPNPAKVTDSRFESYRGQYGDQSWELDALDPATLANVIEPAILALRDDQQWETDVEREREMRSGLMEIANRYDDVVEWLADNDGGES